MTRPLVITDCDEVLLHFARHFRDWLAETHAIDFVIENGFSQALVDRGSGQPLAPERAYEYLHAFFDTEMARQTPIADAVNAIIGLQRDADVVVLTNIPDRFNAARTDQLKAFGIDVPVFTNQGPKGPAIRRIVELYQPSRAVFIDDLAPHHASSLDEAPGVARLHLCGEPSLAPHIACAHQAGHADARIDTWAQALPWIRRQLHGDPA